MGRELTFGFFFAHVLFTKKVEGTPAIYQPFAKSNKGKMRARAFIAFGVQFSAELHRALLGGVGMPQGPPHIAVVQLEWSRTVAFGCDIFGHVMLRRDLVSNMIAAFHESHAAAGSNSKGH